MKGYPFSARTRGARTAVIHETEQLTHAELDERATQLAHAVAAVVGISGVSGESDRSDEPGPLAVVLPNSIELLETLAASAKLGVAPICLDPTMPQPELDEALRAAGADLVIGSLDHADTVRAVAGEPVRAMVVGDDYEARLAEAHDEPLPYLWPATFPTRYLPIAASTGSPFVQREQTVPEIEARCDGLLRRWQITPDDVHLVAGPLHEADPFDHYAATLYAGGTIVLMDDWDAVEFLRLVEAHRVTTTFLAHAHFDDVLGLPPRERGRFDTTSLRGLHHDGPACPEQVAGRLRKIFGAAELSAATAVRR